MAWVVGNTVTPSQKDTAVNVLGAFIAMGRIVDTGAGVQVLWENGSVQTTADDSQLDHVSVDPALVTEWLGRTVQISSASIGNNDQWSKGLVELVYTRTLSGGSIIPSVLVKVRAGVYVDVPIAVITAAA